LKQDTPFVGVKPVEDVFNEGEHEGHRLTEAMVTHKGSEGFRAGGGVLVEELHRDDWHISGNAVRGVRSRWQARLTLRSDVHLD
jgi:hypothetical protein